MSAEEEIANLKATIASYEAELAGAPLADKKMWINLITARSQNLHDLMQQQQAGKYL
jgi:hypothetical protein